LFIRDRARSDRGNALRFIVGGAAGSYPDLIARHLADGLSVVLQRPVIVLNRPGAGGMIATEAVVQAKPDGDTIGLATMSQLIFNVYLFSDLRYDPVRDLAPVATLLTTPMIIAGHPRFEARSFRALIELAKKRPGEIQFATPGSASPPRIVLAIINSATGTRFDVVPFKSDPEALANVLNGEVPLLITAPAIAAPHIRSGNLNGIALTSPTRIAALPGVPTVAESGYPNIDVEMWVGIVAPAGTPPDYVERLNGIIGEIIAAPEFVAYAESRGDRILRSSPQQFSQLIREAHSHWGPLLRHLRSELR
jgi:tripartite-type tricarboxylate transporter receptor subunit TctC